MATVNHMFAQGASAPPQPPPPSGYPTNAPPNYPPNYDAEEARVNEDVTLGTADTKVKLGFLRKVYGMLTFCLAITVGISCVFAFVEPVRDYVVMHPWLLWIGLSVGIGSYIALVCVPLKKPWNALMLGVFVLGFSVMIGVITAQYFAAGWGKVVLQAFAATVCIFVGLTVYVLITKKDFSYLGGFLLGAVIALIVVTVITFFSGLFLSAGARRWLYFAVSVFGALLYTLFILYDTSLILHKYGPDDWIQGVVSLYVDCKLALLFVSCLCCSLTSLCVFTLFSYAIIHVPRQHYIMPPVRGMVYNIVYRIFRFGFLHLIHMFPYININYCAIS